MDSDHTCLAVISLDSAFKKDQNCFLKVLLKEFKYIKEKVIIYINDKLRKCSYSDESDEQ